MLDPASSPLVKALEDGAQAAAQHHGGGEGKPREDEREGDEEVLVPHEREVVEDEAADGDHAARQERGKRGKGPRNEDDPPRIRVEEPARGLAEEVNDGKVPADISDVDQRYMKIT